MFRSTFSQGETLGLVGESGSGKSTLGRLILRLIEPTAGSVQFEGRDLLAASGCRTAPDSAATCRSSSRIHLAHSTRAYRVEDVIAEPLILHEPMSREARRQRVAELLRAVGLDDSAVRRYPHEFSGGQRQRIGIARALALRPKFIVADEPVSALDVSVGAQIVNLLRAVAARVRTHLPVYFSLHAAGALSVDPHCGDVSRARSWKSARPRQITARPQHAYTSSLLAATPEMAAQ